MQTIDIELIEQFTGQRRIDSVDAALAELQPIKDALHATAAKIEPLSIRLAAARRERRWVTARLKFAALPKKLSVPSWVVGLALCGIASFSIGIAVVFLIHAGAAVIIAGTIAPFVALAMLPLLFPSDLSRLEKGLIVKRDEIEAIEREHATLQQEIEDLTLRFTEAKRIYDGVVRARDFPMARLLAIDFKQLSGPEFEAFLADIFRYLGYAVRSTANSGDQGIDLLIERDGKMIAIAAKSHCPSVGTSAVQEVHTGMSVYARRGVFCDQCAVIAASGFTAGAMEAARAVDCRLVDGEQIAGLIKGQMTL